jgi:hypothetical protein
VRRSDIHGPKDAIWDCDTFCHGAKVVVVDGVALSSPDTSWVVETTSFVGAIETAEQSGKRIYAEAVHRGLLNAEKVVVLGDGAEWHHLTPLHVSFGPI